jgi:hypothetical protein
MINSIWERLSYANVVATIALFVALGGGAYAAFHLPKNSVRSKHIKNGQVKSADVKNDALAGTDIDESTLGAVPNANAVGPLHAASGSVSLDDLPGDSADLMTLGPFSFTVGCQYAGGGTIMSVRLQSTRSGTDVAWIVGNDDGTVDADKHLDLAANTTQTLLQTASSSGTLDLYSVHVVAQTPNLTPFAPDNITADLLFQAAHDTSGKECKVSGTAVGT